MKINGFILYFLSYYFPLNMYAFAVHGRQPIMMHAQCCMIQEWLNRVIPSGMILRDKQLIRDIHVRARLQFVVVRRVLTIECF